MLQVLGLTYANFRARAVAIVGEPLVGALEQAADVFKVIVSEGIPGLWRFIKEKLTDLKSMVLDAIFDYVKEKVIVAGITWIIGLLNPASAFFKACKAIYDIVMFFIDRGSQILALVNADHRFDRPRSPRASSALPPLGSSRRSPRRSRSRSASSPACLVSAISAAPSRRPSRRPRRR